MEFNAEDVKAIKGAPRGVTLPQSIDDVSISVLINSPVLWKVQRTPEISCHRA